MFCKFCGTQINDDDLFCPNCGQRRTNVASGANASGTGTTQQQQQTANATQTPQEATASLTDEEQLENAFITGNPSGAAGVGNSFLHYKKSFAAFKMGSSTKWNWASFSASILNIAYRKQYSLAAILAGISFILPFVLLYIGTHTPLYGLSDIYEMLPHLAGIIIAIISGCIADKSLYKRFTKLKDLVVANFPNDIEKQKECMAQNGGTKIVAVVIFVIVGMVSAILYSILPGIIFGEYFFGHNFFGNYFRNIYH